MIKKGSLSFSGWIFVWPVYLKFNVESIIKKSLGNADNILALAVRHNQEVL